MKTPLKSRDLELLSAYLDNRLADRERTALEARLAKDRHLQTELAELRTTVQALRSLPKLKAPRNYTLSPETAEALRRRPWSFFPALQVMATLSTALFLLVVGVDAFSRFSSGGALTASAPSAPMVAQATAAPQLEMAQAPTDTTAAEPYAEATPMSTEAPAAPAEGQAKVSTPEPGAPEGVGGGGTDMAMTETPVPAIAADANPTDAARSAAGAATSVPEEIAPASAPEPAAQPAAPRVTLLQLETVLGLLALLLGTATFLARRFG